MASVEWPYPHAAPTRYQHFNRDFVSDLGPKSNFVEALKWQCIKCPNNSDLSIVR